MEDKKDTQTTHILKLVIVAMLCFVVLVFTFGVGIFVGQERANFSFRWAENYHRNFGGPKMGLFSNFPDSDFVSGHGIFGQVITIDGNTIIIKGQNNREATVVVSAQTTIVNSAAAIKLSAIKINDMAVVIGSPDAQGRVQAKFIRILPPQGITLMRVRNININESL